jgi:hypothetical protein
MNSRNTIIEPIAQALSSLGLEDGQIYKSNFIWKRVRRALGMSVKDQAWKRINANIKQQLVEMGAIERIPGKYQMKIVDSRALATFTRDYRPRGTYNRAGRQQPLQLEQVTPEQVTPEQVTPEQVTPEQAPHAQEEEVMWALTLKESEIIRLLSEKVITLSDVVGG